MMGQQLALTALLIRGYDEALAFYVGTLGFDLREDRQLSPGKRWVVVAPSASSAGLLLARVSGKRQSLSVGQQAGGRVFMFLHTDDFWRDYVLYTERGVAFIEQPRCEPYGTVAVFEDLYGNRWDLVEPAA